MKKLVILLCFSLLLCGCKKDEITEITASLILPQEKVAPYLDYNPNFFEKTTRRCSTAEYRPNQAGAGDPVIIKVYQENQLMSENSIISYFNECRDYRPDSFSIDSLDVDCFVAYPSIHYYLDGYHVEIIAGSGSDNNQKILLMNLAKISLDNLKEYKEQIEKN